MTDFDVYLVIDSEGDYAVGVGPDEANDAYDNDIGCRGERVLRVVKVPVRATLPRVVELAAVAVPDDE